MDDSVGANNYCRSYIRPEHNHHTERPKQSVRLFADSKSGDQMPGGDATYSVATPKKP